MSSYKNRIKEIKKLKREIKKLNTTIGKYYWSTRV